MLSTILRWAIRAGWPPWVFLLTALALLPRTAMPIDSVLRWIGDLVHRPVAFAAARSSPSAEEQGRAEEALRTLAERARKLRGVEARRVAAKDAVLRAGEVVFADVLWRDGESWVLSAGRTAGVVPGDFATCGDQLVGKVLSVEEHASRMIPISSPTVRVPGWLSHDSVSRELSERRIEAVIQGAPEQSPWPLRVQNPSRELPLDGVPVRVSLGPDAFRALREAKDPLAHEQLRRVEGALLGWLRNHMRLRREFYVEPAQDLQAVTGVFIHVRAASPSGAVPLLRGEKLHTRCIDPLDGEFARRSLGVSVGTADGVFRGAPVVHAGRLLGEIATGTPWSARILPWGEPQHVFPGVLLLEGVDVISSNALRCTRRNGGLVWVALERPLAPGLRGELYAGPRDVPGWKGIYIGPFVVAEDGLQLAVAFRAVRDGTLTILRGT